MNNGEFYQPSQAAEHGVPLSNFNQQPAAYIGSQVIPAAEVTGSVPYDDSGELYAWNPADVTAAIAAKTTSITEAARPVYMHGSLGRAIAATALAFVTLAQVQGDKGNRDYTSPSAKSIAVSEQLLAEPSLPFTVEEETPPPFVEGDVNAEYNYNMLQFSRREYVANTYGLTVFNASKLVRNLATKDATKTSFILSPEEAFQQVKEFVAQYDIELVTAPEDEAYSYNLYGLPSTWLNAPNARDTLIGIAKDIATMPKEYNDRLGEEHRVKRIILAAQREKPSSAAAYTTPYDSTENTKNAVVVNTSNAYSPYTLGHEYWHRWSAKLSHYNKINEHFNSTFKDAAGDPEYGQKPSSSAVIQSDIMNGNGQGFITLAQYDELIVRQKKIIATHIYSPDCAEKAKQATDVIEAAGKHTAFNTDYAAKEMDEQQAEIARVFMAGDDPRNKRQYDKIISPYLPLLRAEFLHEISRLGEYNTALRDYFLTVSYHKSFNPAEEMKRICVY
jgi:hypothetical protein